MLERQSAMEQLGDNVFDSVKHSENSGRFWGTIDFLNVGDTEICVMYFTTEYMNSEIESALNGSVYQLIFIEAAGLCKPAT